MKQALTLILSIAFFVSNCVFSYAAEANLWQERRTQLASLPKNIPLPSITKPTLSASSLNSKLLQTKSPQQFPSIPHHLGRVRDIQINGDTTILHIQDIHSNFEAQSHISEIIQNLLKEKQIDLVAVEGAFDEIDLTPFRQFPHPDLIQTAAQNLLFHDHISGPFSAGLTALTASVPFVGIDDRHHYDKNVDAYTSASSLQESKKRDLLEQRKTLTAQKQSLFNNRLKQFDDRAQAYHQGHLPIGAFLKLLKSATKQTHQSIDLFLTAWNFENKLDLKAIERDRTTLINKLVSKLSDQQRNQLLQTSVAYRTGRVSHVDFYSHVKTLCANANVNLKDHASLNQYIEYLILSDKINVKELFADIRALETAAYTRLTQTNEEKKLIQQSRQLSLTGKLVDFSLTPEEWNEYKTTEGFDSFEDFYRHAKARDEAMVANLKKAMAQHKAKKALLVTGGFHSAGIQPALTQNNFSVLSITPHLSKIDPSKGSDYLSVFTQEKGPLEEIFEGRKLFLARKTGTAPQQVRVLTFAVALGTLQGLIRAPKDLFLKTLPSFLASITFNQKNNATISGTIGNDDSQTDFEFRKGDSVHEHDLRFAKTQPVPFTSGLWERLRADRRLAIEHLGPTLETYFTFIVAAATYAISFYHFEFIGFLSFLISVAAGQIFFLLIHLAGIYVEIDGEVSLVYLWDKRIRNKQQIVLRIMRFSLLFNFLFYLGIMAISYLAIVFHLLIGVETVPQFIAFVSATVATTVIILFVTLTWAMLAHQDLNRQFLRSIENRSNNKLRAEIDQTEQLFREGKRISDLLSRDEIPTTQLDAELILKNLRQNTLAGLMRLQSNPDFKDFTIAVITRPGTSDNGGALSISELNDLIGMALNDEIIDAHNTLIRRVLQRANEEYRQATGDDKDAILLLSQNYNSISIAVRPEALKRNQIDFKKINSELKRELFAFINGKNEIRRILHTKYQQFNGNIPEGWKFDEEGRIIDLPYALHYGIGLQHQLPSSQSEQIDTIVGAYSQAISAMNLGRISPKDADNPVFSEEKISEVMTSVYGEAGLVPSMQKFGNLLVERRDKNEQLYLSVSESILAAVRKKSREDAIQLIQEELKLETSGEAEEAFELVLTYYKHLRILDFTTPWATLEDKNEVIRLAQKTKKAIKWLEEVEEEIPEYEKRRTGHEYPRQSESEVERNRHWNIIRHNIARILSKDPRAPSLGSRAQYFQPTSGLRSSYIAIDVERFGAMIFQEQEAAGTRLWDEQERVSQKMFSKEALQMGTQTLTVRTRYFQEALTLIQDHLEQYKNQRAEPATSHPFWGYLRYLPRILGIGLLWDLYRHFFPSELTRLQQSAVFNYTGGDEIFFRLPAELLGLRSSLKRNETESTHDLQVFENVILKQILDLASKHGLVVRLGAAGERITRGPRNKFQVAAVAHKFSGTGHTVAKEAKSMAIKIDGNGATKKHSFAIRTPKGEWLRGVMGNDDDLSMAITQQRIRELEHMETDDILVEVSDGDGQASWFDDKYYSLFVAWIHEPVWAFLGGAMAMQTLSYFPIPLLILLSIGTLVTTTIFWLPHLNRGVDKLFNLRVRLFTLAYGINFVIFSLGFLHAGMAVFSLLSVLHILNNFDQNQFFFAPEMAIAPAGGVSVLDNYDPKTEHIWPMGRRGNNDKRNQGRKRKKKKISDQPAAITLGQPLPVETRDLNAIVGKLETYLEDKPYKELANAAPHPARHADPEKDFIYHIEGIHATQDQFYQKAPSILDAMRDAASGGATDVVLWHESGADEKEHDEIFRFFAMFHERRRAAKEFLAADIGLNLSDLQTLIRFAVNYVKLNDNEPQEAISLYEGSTAVFQILAKHFNKIKKRAQQERGNFVERQAGWGNELEAVADQLGIRRLAEISTPQIIQLKFMIVSLRQSILARSAIEPDLKKLKPDLLKLHQLHEEWMRRRRLIAEAQIKLEKKNNPNLAIISLKGYDHRDEHEFLWDQDYRVLAYNPNVSDMLGISHKMRYAHSRQGQNPPKDKLLFLHLLSLHFGYFFKKKLEPAEYASVVIDRVFLGQKIASGLRHSESAAFWTDERMDQFLLEWLDYFDKKRIAILEKAYEKYERDKARKKSIQKLEGKKGTNDGPVQIERPTSKSFAESVTDPEMEAFMTEMMMTPIRNKRPKPEDKKHDDDPDYESFQEFTLAAGDELFTELTDELPAFIWNWLKKNNTEWDDDYDKVNEGEIDLPATYGPLLFYRQDPPLRKSASWIDDPMYENLLAWIFEPSVAFIGGALASQALLFFGASFLIAILMGPLITGLIFWFPHLNRGKDFLFNDRIIAFSMAYGFNFALFSMGFMDLGLILFAILSLLHIVNNWFESGLLTSIEFEMSASVELTARSSWNPLEGIILKMSKKDGGKGKRRRKEYEKERNRRRNQSKKEEPKRTTSSPRKKKEIPLHAKISAPSEFTIQSPEQDQEARTMGPQLIEGGRVFSTSEPLDGPNKILLRIEFAEEEFEHGLTNEAAQLIVDVASRRIAETKASGHGRSLYIYNADFVIKSGDRTLRQIKIKLAGGDSPPTLAPYVESANAVTRQAVETIEIDVDNVVSRHPKGPTVHNGGPVTDATNEYHQGRKLLEMNKALHETDFPTSKPIGVGQFVSMEVDHEGSSKRIGMEFDGQPLGVTVFSTIGLEHNRVVDQLHGDIKAAQSRPPSLTIQQVQMNAIQRNILSATTLGQYVRTGFAHKQPHLRQFRAEQRESWLFDLTQAENIFDSGMTRDQFIFWAMYDFLVFYREILLAVQGGRFPPQLLEVPVLISYFDTENMPQQRRDEILQAFGNVALVIQLHEILTGGFTGDYTQLAAHYPVVRVFQWFAGEIYDDLTQRFPPSDPSSPDNGGGGETNPAGGTPDPLPLEQELTEPGEIFHSQEGAQARVAFKLTDRAKEVVDESLGEGAAERLARRAVAIASRESEEAMEGAEPNARSFYVDDIGGEVSFQVHVFPTMRVKNVRDADNSNHQLPQNKKYETPPGATVRQPSSRPDIDPDGRAGMTNVVPQPRGSGNLPDNVREHDSMWEALYRNNATSLPIGVGQFIGDEFIFSDTNQPMGFLVVVTITNERDRFHTLNLREERSGIEINSHLQTMTDRFAQQVQATSQLNQSGLIHRDPHGDQFTQSNGRTYVFDLESAKPHRETLTRAQFIYWVLRDFLHLYRGLREGMDDFLINYLHANDPEFPGAVDSARLAGNQFPERFAMRRRFQFPGYHNIINGQIDVLIQNYFPRPLIDAIGIDTLRQLLFVPNDAQQFAPGAWGLQAGLAPTERMSFSFLDWDANTNEGQVIRIFAQFAGRIYDDVVPDENKVPAQTNELNNDVHQMNQTEFANALVSAGIPGDQAATVAQQFIEERQRRAYFLIRYRSGRHPFPNDNSLSRYLQSIGVEPAQANSFVRQTSLPTLADQLIELSPHANQSSFIEPTVPVPPKNSLVTMVNVPHADAYIWDGVSRAWAFGVNNARRPENTNPPSHFVMWREGGFNIPTWDAVTERLHSSYAISPQLAANELAVSQTEAIEIMDFVSSWAPIAQQGVSVTTLVARLELLIPGFSQSWGTMNAQEFSDWLRNVNPNEVPFNVQLAFNAIPDSPHLLQRWGPENHSAWQNQALDTYSGREKQLITALDLPVVYEHLTPAGQSLFLKSTLLLHLSELMFITNHLELSEALREVGYRYSDLHLQSRQKEKEIQLQALAKDKIGVLGNGGLAHENETRELQDKGYPVTGFSIDAWEDDGPHSVFPQEHHDLTANPEIRITEVFLQEAMNVFLLNHLNEKYGLFAAEVLHALTYRIYHRLPLTSNVTSRRPDSAPLDFDELQRVIASKNLLKTGYNRGDIGFVTLMWMREQGLWRAEYEDLMMGRWNPTQHMRQAPIRLIQTPPGTESKNSLTGKWGGIWMFGLVMPLFEEGLRLASSAYLEFNPVWTILIFSLILTALHIFTDVNELGLKGYFATFASRQSRRLAWIMGIGAIFVFLSGIGAPLWFSFAVSVVVHSYSNVTQELADSIRRQDIAGVLNSGSPATLNLSEATADLAQPAAKPSDEIDLVELEAALASFNVPMSTIGFVDDQTDLSKANLERLVARLDVVATNKPELVTKLKAAARGKDVSIVLVPDAFEPTRLLVDEVESHLDSLGLLKARRWKMVLPHHLTPFTDNLDPKKSILINALLVLFNKNLKAVPLQSLNSQNFGKVARLLATQA